MALIWYNEAEANLHILPEDHSDDIPVAVDLNHAQNVRIADIREDGFTRIFAHNANPLSLFSLARPERRLD
jgi:hypothetical protein